MKKTKILSIFGLFIMLVGTITMYSCSKSSPKEVVPEVAKTTKQNNKSANNLSWAVNLFVNDSNFRLFAQKLSEINNEINTHFASLTPEQKIAAIASVRQNGSPENIALNWGYTLSKNQEVDLLYAQIMQNNPSLISIGMENMGIVIQEALKTKPDPSYDSYPCLTDNCCWNYYNEARTNAQYMLKKGIITKQQHDSYMAHNQTKTNNCLEDGV